MKKVTDLKENECIHCPTKEEFKAILELNPDNNIRLDRWNLNKKNTVYYPFRHRRTGGFADLKYANEEFNFIHPASDFLEPTYQLTKSQIIAIAENCSLVKELFPECFEVELEIGRWYKGFSYLGSYFLGVYGKKENSDIIYGFWNGKWDDNENGLIFIKDAKSFEPATSEEVTEAFKKYCIEKGFVDGARVKGLITGSICVLDFYFGEKFYLSSNEFMLGGACVFKNGQFAEIIKTPTEVIKVIETYGKDKLITLIEAYERNSK